MYFGEFTSKNIFAIICFEVITPIAEFIKFSEQNKSLGILGDDQ
jgi:hypothetical protein